jgi:hypothetical protein
LASRTVWGSQWLSVGLSVRKMVVLLHSSYGFVWKSCTSLDWFKGKSTGNHGFYHQI